MGRILDEDQRRVEIDDAVAGVLDLFEGQVEEDRRVGVFPARVAGREEAADVPGRDGAEQRVGDGVQQHVAVGVAGEALGMLDVEAADAQGHSGGECVGIPAATDSQAHGLVPIPPSKLRLL
jgi:hypothetical protein